MSIFTVFKRIKALERRVKWLEQRALTPQESEWVQARAEQDPLYGRPIRDRKYPPETP